MMRQIKDSYLPDGCLAQQDELDTAARLGWHSGRVCHNTGRRIMQVHDKEGVVADYAQHEVDGVPAAEKSRDSRA